MVAKIFNPLVNTFDTMNKHGNIQVYSIHAHFTQAHSVLDTLPLLLLTLDNIIKVSFGF